MSNVPKLRFKEFSEEWKNTNIGSIGTFFSGGTPTSSNKSYYEGSIPFIGSGKIGANEVEQFITEEALKNSSAKIVDIGDLLYALYGATSGEVAISKINGAINQAVLCIRTDENKIFLKTWLEKNKENILSTYLQGGQGNLSTQIVKSLKLYLPLKQEQEKIASFLNQIDIKIEQLTKKEKLLQQYKKGVMQKIFNQEIRFKADDGSEFCDWKKEKLNKYLVEYKNKSTFENEYSVLTSSNKGLMLQSDYFGENRLTERDNIGFNIVPCNFITYRSRSDNRSFTFNINELGYTGIISTYYPVFECKNADNRFMVTLLNKNKHFIGKYSVGTSQTVLSFNELKNIKMLIPCIEEQIKIANFLSSIDTKIEQVQKQLESSKEFKKALLQQMFV